MIENENVFGGDKMKIVVFGGGGFIGSTVVDRLLQDGHELRIFEHPRVKPYRTFSAFERVEWFAGDMLSMHDVSTVVDGMDVVLHLVSFTLPKNSNDDILYDVQTNLTATIQLLNAMVAYHVKRIVFISSGGTVYGVPKYIPIDEEHPTTPLVSYGIIKLTIEKYLLLFQHLHGIKPIILRVSNAYGPRQRLETAQGAVTIFLSRALQGLPIEIWGDGSVIRDYIYVGDVADAIANALKYRGEKNEFNISSSRGYSLNELLDEIEILINKPLFRKYQEKRPFDVLYNVLNNKLAERELNWQPRVGLRDGLLKTADWLEKNRRPEERKDVKE